MLGYTMCRSPGNPLAPSSTRYCQFREPSTRRVKFARHYYRTSVPTRRSTRDRYVSSSSRKIVSNCFGSVRNLNQMCESSQRLAKTH